MVLFVLLCVLKGIELNAWEFSRNDRYGLLETWGIKSVIEIEREKIQQQFKDDNLVTCGSIYKTAETPFVAIILQGKSGAFLCMGSIIDHSHILTAKRCYEKVDAPELKALLGCFKAYWGRNSQVLPVRKIIRHEYEVAMLRLGGHINYTPYVKAVKLPPHVTAMITEFEKVFSAPYKVVGFAVDRFDVPGDAIGKDKYYRVMEDQMVGFDICKKNFTKLTIVKNNVFCTFGNATFCWGGLGGPILKWDLNGRFFIQVGVVVADNCTTTETGPYLAVRTDVIAEWILGNAIQGHQPL